MTQLDNTFNIKRFKNLSRLIIANRWKRDALGALLLFILTTIGSYLVFRFSRDTLGSIDKGEYLLDLVKYVSTSNKTKSIFSFLLAVTGAVYILSFVKELSPKHPRASNYLMLPVSAFERITSVFLFASLSYTIVVAILLTIGMNIGLFAAGLRIESFSYNFIPLFKGHYWILFTTILMTQQIYMIGSFYFRKSVFMKTSLIILLLSAGYQFISALTLTLFTKIASPFDLPFYELLNIAMGISSRVDIEFEESIFYSSYLILPVLFICFWSFAYFKIREKEIK